MAVVIFCLLAVVSVGYLGYAVARRYRYTQLGRPEDRNDRPLERWRYFFRNVVMQKKVWDYPLFGLSHLFIMAGFPVLLAGMPNMVAEGLFGRSIPYIGDNYGYLLLKDAANGLILLGLCGALLRRIIHKPAWLKNSVAAFGKLGLIFIIVLTEVFFHGARLVLGEEQPLRQAAPLALAAARLWADFEAAAIYQGMMMLWWTHFLAVFGFCFFIPHSSHLHLIFAPFNAYWLNLAPKGALHGIRTGMATRADKLEDLTWKQLFDAYACVKCGRCNGQCPAQLSGESLKPKALNARLRKHIEQRAPKLLGKKAAWATDGAAAADKPARKQTGDRRGTEKSLRHLVGETYEEDFIWGCTTCGACMEACPVSTEQMSKIIDLRRHLVLGGGGVDGARQRFFDGIAEEGNPWGYSQRELPPWAQELSVPVILKSPGAEYLYYAGCAAAFDERAGKTAAAFVRILQAAGVNFAIMGNLAWCCGETARRMGHEVLFERAVKFNIDTWRKLKIKKIITTCPHCFNTLKNEYPQYGGNFRVIHHAAFLADLLREGKLKADKAFARVISFHDPCYLGRYNDLTGEPREVLAAVPAVRLREMPRARKQAFCCGAGGGRIWTMPPANNAITANRVREAADTGAEVIGTACPYCAKACTEAAAAKGAPLQVMDIAEILAASL